MAEAKAADLDTRFEVEANAREELQTRVAKLESEVATLRKQMEAVSAQVSIDVMRVKAEEPKTKQRMDSLTPQGWDTSAMDARIRSDGKSVQ